MENRDGRSLPDLVLGLTRDLAELVRKESELVRTEVSEKLATVGRAGAGLGIGAALLIGAFLLLLQAVVLALSKLMDPVWATILVGASAGLAGFLLVRSSAAKLSPAELTPDRSTRQLGKDLNLVKGQMP
jgi:hypothetical protein